MSSYGSTSYPHVIISTYYFVVSTLLLDYIIMLALLNFYLMIYFSLQHVL